MIYIIIFYLTATGNCLSLAKEIGGNLISIPQAINLENLHYKDDAVGIIFPVYSCRAPKIVLEFLDKVKIEANYTFAIATYGNIAGATLVNLQKHVKNKGFQFDYVDKLLTVDNYLPMFEMDDQLSKLPQKKTKENTEKIVQNINNRISNEASASLGTKAFTSFIRHFDNVFYNGKQAQKFLVNSNCTKCNVCAKVCPVQNINVTDKVNFSNHCISCFGCIHQCPQNAIHLKNEKSEKRWINENVSLKEIIDANNQLK